MAASASPPTRSRRPVRDGFLLTETLATFTISAFVLLGLVSASTVLVRAVDWSVARAQDADELGRTMASIARDVSGLTRARWNGYEPQDFVFRGGPNSLFFTSARRNPDGSRETSVVALREIVVGSGTRMMRGEAPLSARATGFHDLRFGPQRELGTGLARLRFFYVAPGDGKAERPKQHDWPLGRQLPVAVVIEAVDRETGALLVSRLVPVHANSDIGCLSGEEPQDESAAKPPNVSGSGAVTQTESETTLPSSPSAAGPSGSRAPTAHSGFCGRADEDAAPPGADGRTILPTSGSTSQMGLMP